MKIAVLGLVVTDVMTRVDRWCTPGNLLVVPEIEMRLGGCAANTGVALAKLGVAPLVIAKVGYDKFGDFAVEEMKYWHVDCRGVVRDDGPTSSSMILVEAGSGDRTIYHCPGGNGRFVRSDVDWTLLSECQHLHIAGTGVMPSFDGEMTVKVLQSARELGLTTSLDTVYNADFDPELLWPALEHVTVLFSSLPEAEMYTGVCSPQEVAKAFQRRGAKTVVLKNGEHGSFLRSNLGDEVEVPAFKVEAVDGTGSGDAFCAGFLYAGLVQGKLMDARKESSYGECLRLGNALGAMCVRKLGATEGIEYYRGTQEFMAQHLG